MSSHKNIYRKREDIHFRNRFKSIAFLPTMTHRCHINECVCVFLTENKYGPEQIVVVVVIAFVKWFKRTTFMFLAIRDIIDLRNRADAIFLFYFNPRYAFLSLFFLFSFFPPSLPFFFFFFFFYQSHLIANDRNLLVNAIDA